MSTNSETGGDGVSLPIEDYALVGDCQAAALVSARGSIDWLCLPRFDSPSCFAALVGSPANGRWSICPRQPFSTRRAYRENTLVLETLFETAGGVVRLVDCMPPRQGRPRFFRTVEGVSGEVEMVLELLAVFEYGAVNPLVEASGHTATMTAGPDTLRLWSAVDTRVIGHTVTANFSVVAGQQVSFELVWHPSHEDPPFPIVGQAATEAVEQFWREWVGRCTYTGPFREAVVRSLITLKALTYAPTGGMVAAPSTSLPERIGGSRNWDYRYCWVRDSALALGAFMRCGYHDEATAWWTWLQRASAGDPGKLQVLYGVGGERHLAERNLTWLRGYRDSKPVRVGNAAAGQAQIDLYGELINAFHNYRATAIFMGEHSAKGLHWDQEVALVDYLNATWHKPDRSIWEVRDKSRHFTFSKVMAWVAFDRAISDAEAYGFKAPVAHWRKARATIKGEVLARGVSPKGGHFTMAYDLDELDASLLLIPVLGFLPADDHRVVATIDAIASQLDLGGLTRRYIPGAPGPKDAEMGLEGVFIPASFWLVDALALSGRLPEATVRFKHLLSLANDVGLLSEEYDPIAGHQLGNFPQAFSHVALIDSACYLEAAIAGQGVDVGPHGLFDPQYADLGGAKRRGSGLANSSVVDVVGRSADET